VRASSFARVAFVSILGLGIAGACTYGHQEAQSGATQPLVFPGEARLGASVFMAIDSNLFGIGDHLERYDLHRDRVQIFVQGNLATVEAEVRSVFAVESGRPTADAEFGISSWMMVALFDLPDASANAFSAPYPRHAPLVLKIDGQTVPELQGVVWVIGEGGEPTSLDATPLLPSLEDELEPRTLVRLRARGGTTTSNGFLPSLTIAAMQVEVDYDPDCLEAPSAHAGSEAIGGGVTVGPPRPAPSTSPSGWERITVLLTHPRGFSLPAASPIDPSRLGTGPILDLAFDRIDTPSCDDPLSQYVEVRVLRVSDRNGKLTISRPSPNEESTFDETQFFHIHYVDPEQPS
jgi:hypothetical protein